VENNKTANESQIANEKSEKVTLESKNNENNNTKTTLESKNTNTNNSAKTEDKSKSQSPPMLTISTSPHIREALNIQGIMFSVIIAITPAIVTGIFQFGINAAINLAVGAVAAVLSEYIWQKAMGQKITISDGSACLTGLLLAMSMSPLLPAYMVAIGSAIAIIVAKQSMGGLGFNIFNPAHIGRAALMVSWPIAMTTWTAMPGVDAVTGATPLNVLKMEGYEKVVEMFGSQSQMYLKMFVGAQNGSIGETSSLLIICGGIYLIWKKIIKWHIPAVMIGTVAVITWIFGPNGLFTGDPLFHVLAGGLMLGAFFMATDMVTAPMTVKGQVIFAAGAGAITALIRLVGGYPEGVCYSILLMNSLTPLIDRVTKPRIFGIGGKNK